MPSASAHWVTGDASPSDATDAAEHPDSSIDGSRGDSSTGDSGTGQPDSATGLPDSGSGPPESGIVTGRPCDDLCSAPEIVSLGEDGFRVEPLGTRARCLEVTGYRPLGPPRVVCWEFVGSRVLRVNGSNTPCLANGGVPLGEERNGGYCIWVSAGDHDYAGVLLPTK
jgi:hypothetical protein